MGTLLWTMSPLRYQMVTIRTLWTALIEVTSAGFLHHWAGITGVLLEDLICTTYRAVESDVGKEKGSDMEKVSALAVAQGGGW